MRRKASEGEFKNRQPFEKHSKPFSFLSQIGGKDTTEARVILTTNDQYLNQTRAAEKGELQVFTQESVDRHDFDVRMRRTMQVQREKHTSALFEQQRMTQQAHQQQMISTISG